MSQDDPPDQKKPWTDSDKAELESILKERRHRQWLSDIIMRWAKWIAAAGLGATVVWDWIARIIKQAGSP